MAEATKQPKPFGKKFQKSPVVLASAHGAYYVTKDTAPFIVPPNVHIIETQAIGDYCLTNIDFYIFNLFQGQNRPFLHSLLRGKKIDATGKEYVDVMKNLTFYQPGDQIYNRVLSIGGGRGSGPGGGGSSRIIYAGMGFFYFPSDPTASFNNTFPKGDRTKFLGELRTKMITDADYMMTYQEFMDYTFKLYPELQNGCIFVFSSCAEAHNVDGMPRHEFDAKVHAIEMLQAEQRRKMLTLTGTGAGGAVEAEDFEEEANAGAAAAAAGGGAAGSTKAPGTSLFAYEMRGSVRSAEPSEFHRSAYGENPEAMSSLANKRWASRFVPERERVKMNKPKGTKQLFEESDGGKTYKQLFVEGTESPYWTLAEIKAYKAKNPAAKLKELKAGDFVDVALSGGKRRRGTRRTSKSSRKTRKSRR